MRVTALFRHPIKSHGREAIERVSLTRGRTMPWDRTWAVTHDATKFDAAQPTWVHCRNFMLGTRTPGLAGIWATLDEDARQVTLTHQDLDDITIRPDDRHDISRFLQWVAPLCPDNRSAPLDVVSVEGRGMTDSNYPSVSVMNAASHTAVEGAMGQPIEIERWRGNIWLEGVDGWEEFGWMGREIQIGEAVLHIRERIKRCTHTSTNTVTGIRDIDTLGVLNETFGHQDFGVYTEVVQSGEVRVGDVVSLL